MFKPGHKVAIGIILFTCYTCDSSGPHLPKSDRTLVDWGTGKSAQVPTVIKKPLVTKKVHGRQKNFLDSVMVKMDLSLRQISQHTNLDNFYFNGDITFTGDTVWFRKSKRPLAVISYDDRGINKKFLLVFNKKGKCTASLMVGMDGDLDGGFDSIVLNYRVIDNNSFSTTETWTHREGKKKDKITVTEQFYWIDSKGSIMAQNNTMRSFTKLTETRTTGHLNRQ